MKIAVPYENGQVFQHFGQTACFKVYDVEDGKVVTSAALGTNGDGHGALAGFLQKQAVDTLICGGIGGGAKDMLTKAGITFYGGVSGDADAAVGDLLAGTLRFDPDASCSSHEEHDEHHGACGEHGCGDSHHHEH